MNFCSYPIPENFRCGLCGGDKVRSWIDLGASPPANNYPSPADISREEKWYPLHAYVCETCRLVQLPRIIPPEQLFSRYPYFSSLSTSWVQHAGRYVDNMISRLQLTNRSTVVEVGSNDGYLLRHFLEKGIPVLGIESAQNVAAEAQAAGIPTHTGFFGLHKARQLAAAGIRADLLIANNVLAHVPDLHGFVEGVKTLLKPEGLFTAEFPHLLRLVEGCQFDTIYHEHAYYFSLRTAHRLFSNHGLRIFEVEELPTHGGSLRIFAGYPGNPHRRRDSSVTEMLAKERAAGMLRMDYYDSFRAQVAKARSSLRHFLMKAKADGTCVAGYGAPAKSATLLNYCSINAELLEFTVDRNPWKQGRYLPGSRVPIFPISKIREVRPDFLLILAWNLREEIMEQMAFIREWGGRFAVPLPEVHLYD